MLRKYSLLLIGLFISLFYFGQIEDPSEKVKWSFSYEQVNCEVTLIATINMNEHWHISAANLPLDCFSIPTSINIDKSPNYLVDDSLIEPQPLHIYDSIIDEHLYWHSGTIEIKRKITINSKDDITIKGYYSFQTCDDTHCLPPYDEDFEIKVRGCSSNEQVVISNKKSLKNKVFRRFGKINLKDYISSFIKR